MPRVENKMFCPFQKRVICVFLNIKCSGDDCVAYCFKMLFVLHLSLNDLTTINLNTNSSFFLPKHFREMHFGRQIFNSNQFRYSSLLGNPTNSQIKEFIHIKESD